MMLEKKRTITCNFSWTIKSYSIWAFTSFHIFLLDLAPELEISILFQLFCQPEVRRKLTAWSRLLNLAWVKIFCWASISENKIEMQETNGQKFEEDTKIGINKPKLFLKIIRSAFNFVCSWRAEKNYMSFWHFGNFLKKCHPQRIKPKTNIYLLSNYFLHVSITISQR